MFSIADAFSALQLHCTLGCRRRDRRATRGAALWADGLALSSGRRHTLSSPEFAPAVELQASQIKARGEATRNHQIACQLQCSLGCSYMEPA
jgi:hypothetical protein